MANSRFDVPAFLAFAAITGIRTHVVVNDDGTTEIDFDAQALRRAAQGGTRAPQRDRTRPPRARDDTHHEGETPWL